MDQGKRTTFFFRENFRVKELFSTVSHFFAKFKPSEYPPIGTNWTNWKIYLQKNEGEAEEMSPDFYTRLGKSGIKIDRGDDKYYTVDEILNLKFGNLNSVIQREKKAFAIAALFSIVVANDTGEILYIGREQRNQFWHPRNAKQRKVQWMKIDGEEFDLQKRLEFFFNDEDQNLGNEDAKLFKNEENKFIVKLL